MIDAIVHSVRPSVLKRMIKEITMSGDNECEKGLRLLFTLFIAHMA